MNIRYYTKDDYNIFKNFWNHYNTYEVPVDSLSPVGIVIEDGDEVVAGTWVYIMDGCNVAQIAWTTLNPKCKIKQKYQILNTLFDAIIITTKKYNKTNLVCFTNGGLKKFFEKKGMMVNKDHSLLIGSL